MLTVAWQLLERYRPGSHQTHIAAHDIQQLRKLVDTRFSKNLADDRDPGVVLQFPRRLPFGSCRPIGSQQFRKLVTRISLHGTKLETSKRSATKADPGMGIKDRAFVTKLHDYCDYQEKRGEEHQSGDRYQKVYRSL